MQHKAAAFTPHRGRFFAALFSAAAIMMLVLGVLAGRSDAQADLDCADFDTQQEAQAELNRDPSDPHGLDADDDGIACEELSDDGGTGDGGTGGRDLDCADFATHGEAQRVLARDPTDPHNLDADDDGVACEELSGAGGADDQQYNAGGKEVTVIIETIPEKKILVDTGGPNLPTISGVFFALGLVGLGIVLLRRT
jgi:hypothetical protein